MSTPGYTSENEEDKIGALAAALDERVLEVILRRAVSVLASTPLEEGEYIAHGLWGHELAARLADPGRDGEFYLMDVRGREAFDEGHVAGAHQVDPGEWASPENLALLPNDRKIIVICENGLTAAQVVAGLRLLGHDAAVLKTGINGWAQTSMTGVLVDEFQSARYPVKRLPPEAGCAPAPAGAIFERPVDSEYDLIAARAHDVFSGGLFTAGGGNVISAAELNALLEDESEREGLFLVDLRREEDFEGVGHIEGSLRMDFDAAAVPANLELLPRDRKIVTICYTGNLAAQLAAVLRLLGYDAAALAYGMVSWTRTPTTQLYLKDIQKADNPLV